MKSTIKTISELAGVSPSTVSNILHGKKSASKDTTLRIQEIAKQVGYRSSTSTDIDTVYFVFYKKHGQVLSNTPFFTALIEGIEKCCRKYNCKMQIYNINCLEDNVQEKVDEILSEENAGLIVMATEMDDDDAKLFSKSKIPLVMLDGWIEDYEFNSVLINNSDAAYKAVRYLIEQGHRKIGYLRSSVYINNFFYRFTGFRRALEKYGIAESNEDNFCWLPPTMDGAYHKMCEYLDTNPELRTAYFADNDEIAIGTMKAMCDRGIRVPEDVSVIGIDDMPYCEVSTPRLTTMRVFKEKMGELAVLKLMDIVRDSITIPVKIQIGTELVIRDSVKCIL